MNEYVLSILSKVIHRRCRSFDWWPYAGFAEWRSVSANCIPSDLLDYKYACVSDRAGNVVVVGFNSLSSIAHVVGDCEVLRVNEIDEVLSNER